MATSHYKINVKDLKGPSEFVTTVDRIGNYLVNNLVRVIIGAVALIAVAALIFTYSFYRSHQDRVAASHFYDALTALNHKDYKTAEQGFASLAQSGSGKLARLAPLYVASAYIADNKPAQARDALETYIADSNHSQFKNLALVQLGVAYEDLGDFKKAHDAYAQAATIAGPAKASAQLGVARTLLKQGDKTGAITAWRNFLAENPFSPERSNVVDSLAALGVAPTDRSPTASAGIPPKATVPTAPQH
jgi:predicted negative regulator of RcsB-dependent stress response